MWPGAGTEDLLEEVRPKVVDLAGDSRELDLEHKAKGLGLSPLEARATDPGGGTRQRKCVPAVMSCGQEERRQALLTSPRARAPARQEKKTESKRAWSGAVPLQGPS